MERFALQRSSRTDHITNVRANCRLTEHIFYACAQNSEWYGTHN